MIFYKMELLVKILIGFNCKLFCSILHVSQVLRSPLTSINQMFFTNSKIDTSRFFGMVTLTKKRPPLLTFQKNSSVVSIGDLRQTNAGDVDEL